MAGCAARTGEGFDHKTLGVGLITWAIKHEVLKIALSYGPHAFMLSFGDPRPYAAPIKQAGCRLICQVQDVVQAKLALEAGADLIVAEGTEAGGHGGVRATLSLVPAVVDAVGSVPVVAAGGIADGRGLAAALMLGAHGALMGTRFYASPEALGHYSAKQRIAQAAGSETVRTRVFDIVRGYEWPGGETGRALSNAFSRSWHGREGELAIAAHSEGPAFLTAVQNGDCDTMMVWASEAIDLIKSIEGAGELVSRIAAEAEARLRSVQELTSHWQTALSMSNRIRGLI
jgi:nitronate monooxygenase